MTFSSTISSKGQITVPLEIRQRLGLKAGDRVEYANRRRQAAGEGPKRPLTDFVIGAHALLHADRLMTLDPIRYCQDFPELLLMTVS